MSALICRPSTVGPSGGGHSLPCACGGIAVAHVDRRVGGERFTQVAAGGARQLSQADDFHIAGAVSGPGALGRLYHDAMKASISCDSCFCLLSES